ncbi:MAG TPA: tetratricopeptide repeat protein [Chthoniobacteraceae bacterium]|nr:tetratricopeptide repeat protein [Chthoniobacteraceae bacterium]
MPSGTIPPQVLRGLQLKEIGRYADAENAFREALAQAPDDAFALHHLAACQFHQRDRHRDALATIHNAIAIEPNEVDHHILRAFILCVLERPKEALAASQAALQLAPNSDAAFTAEAQAHLQLSRWADAERAARQALALDADNSTAANQLAQALRLQNKMAENAGHLAGMLARDPEDPYTHANAGWAALQRGRHREAEVHFREALRLNPAFDSAREGLLNSFRARSPIYRAYLRYCFAMQRLSSGSRWAVIIGLYLAARFGSRMKGGLGLAVMALYFLFVLWVWVARPFGNLMLLFDRFARHALRRNEKIEAAVVGGGLCAGILALGVGMALRSDLLLPAGIGLIAMSFPLAMTFTNGSKIGSILFGTLGAVTLLATILCLVSVALPSLAALAENIFVVGCIGSLASTWLGNISALRRPA